MARAIGIGNQDFETIRKQNYFYIDKTKLIQEWWESGDSVTLITRPRRFGKTLNMSMVEKFFSVQYAGREDLFQGLKIWEDETFRKLQGTYPVLFISFANIKEQNYEMARKHGKSVIIMEPVKGGMLAEPPQTIRDIFRSAEPDASMASWAVRYAASLDGILTVLSGMSNVEQMEDNLSYMKDFQPLTKEEQETVKGHRKHCAR